MVFNSYLPGTNFIDIEFTLSSRSLINFESLEQLQYKFNLPALQRRVNRQAGEY